MIITAEEIFKGVYIGPSVSEHRGSIKIDENLGMVRFMGSVVASGWIHACAGSGIAAVRDIAAGGSISTGKSLEAGGSIRSAGSVVSGRTIEAKGLIKAGEFIDAGHSIIAGKSIEAGLGVEARYLIEAEESIRAGLRISCESLSVRLRVFAGLIMSRLPEPGDDEILVAKLLKGTIAHGRLVIGQQKDAPATQEDDTIPPILIAREI